MIGTVVKRPDRFPVTAGLLPHDGGNRTHYAGFVMRFGLPNPCRQGEDTMIALPSRILSLTALLLVLASLLNVAAPLLPGGLPWDVVVTCDG